MKKKIQAAREVVEAVGRAAICAMPVGPGGETPDFRPDEVLERVKNALNEDEPEFLYGLAVILGEHEAPEA
ncbi:hypothetical protein [Pelomicrobium methylotrophicum]|uniref:Uncharacterized protein n=1 Tax=Pelomicrobium methylotrophicum TaxID=2602750 RepID=A0A5C7ESI4_9PROT|nr:hypothetical protein [Pelomicrobium methylotrophicum]TXF11627.1 hypothetical protein FR698_09820 [Pelomicrobium methylotrophicum]